jgi:hypothetical protein
MFPLKNSLIFLKLWIDHIQAFENIFIQSKTFEIPVNPATSKQKLVMHITLT